MAENSVQREFVAVDLETSGIDPRFCEIIEVGAVRFDASGKVLGELDMLVRPTRPVPEAILRLTGISQSELERAASWEEVRPKVQEFVEGAALVGQSINFDMDFLRFGGVKLSGEWYDTWHLSTALFPGLEAYSLEALSDEFGIELEDAHRAVSDCHASRELFLYDCYALNSLDAKVKAELQELSSRSKYPIGNLIQELPEGNEPPSLREKGSAARGSAADLTSVLDGGEGRRLLVLSPGTDVTESLATSMTEETPKSIIALSSSTDQRHLLNALEKRNVHAAVLLDQSSVVSVKRLEPFLQQNKYSLTEAIFSSKLIIWRHKTERGARDELSLAGEEYTLWRQISCDGMGREELADEPFWQNHLGEVSGARQLLTTFRGLPEQHLPDGVPLIVGDYQLFDEMMTSHLSAHLFSDSRAGEEESAQSSVDIVWGLLGMIVRNLSTEGSGSLLVNDRVRASQEWRQLQDALANTHERAKGQSRNIFIAAQLQEILDSDRSWVVWVDSDGERVSVHRSPIDLNPLIDRLSAARGCLLLSSGFVRMPEGFEAVESPLTLHRPKARVMLLEDAPAPNNPSSTEYLRRLLQAIIKEEPQRRIYVAFSSKASAAEFAGICGDAIDGRPLIGEGVSGNFNRTRLMWRRDPSQIVLGSMRSNRQGFLSCEFDTVLVPKLSFDPPGIPLHEARGALRGGFSGYTIPRAAAKVLQLFSKLDPSGECELFLADGRLISAKYGKDILKQLGLDIESAPLERAFSTSSDTGSGM